LLQASASSEGLGTRSGSLKREDSVTNAPFDYPLAHPEEGLSEVEGPSRRTVGKDAVRPSSHRFDCAQRLLRMSGVGVKL
jgi:hypothetical protein